MGPNPAQPALEVHSLHAGYGETDVLDGIDLSVADGEIVSLLGPSGCGKTTLLRCIAGFVTPSSGVIRIHGREVFGPRGSVVPERRQVGLVPQEGALFPHLDVGANVAFGLAGMSRRESRARVEEVLAMVGLAGWQRRRPAELSGGQQQRVALARALAPSPRLVLLDEPFSALDAGLRQQVREEVRLVLSRARVATVMVTHDQAEALSFSERAAVMDRGRILQVDDPATLYRHPADPVVGAFVGDSTQLPGLRHAGTVDTALGVLRVDGGPAGSEVAHEEVVAVLVRPEQVRLGAEGSGVAAEVLGIQYFGHDALVRLGLADGTELLARVQGTCLPARGSRVGLSVEGDVAVFDHPS